MNKIYALSLVAAALSASAQSLVTIHGINSEPQSVDAAEIKEIMFERIPQTPEADSEWVDLGLPSGLLWRSSNLGAGVPEASGSLFHFEQEQAQMDNLDFLLRLSNYRMRSPTDYDMEELFENCTVASEEVGGVRGVRFTGVNGNSIFLPAAGILYDSGDVVWKNVMCDYLLWRRASSHPLRGLSLNACRPEYWYTSDIDRQFRHPAYTTGDYGDFHLPVRPVKDTVKNIVYGGDWQNYFNDYDGDTIELEIIASGRPELHCDESLSDFISWTVDDCGEVPDPENLDVLYKSLYSKTIDTFHKWKVTLTLLPLEDGGYRYLVVSLEGYDLRNIWSTPMIQIYQRGH